MRRPDCQQDEDEDPRHDIAHPLHVKPGIRVAGLRLPSSLRCQTPYPTAAAYGATRKRSTIGMMPAPTRQR
jgi:hypothetical protein